ncbi:MAG: transposase [Gammaproteobacteria bacterium]|nr:transposase [Gammaproteobacteria bacterium]
MADILAHLQSLEPYLTSTTVRQFSHIVAAMLMMTGRVTMLGMSRWTDKGGSYRTIQRFFTTAIPWALVCWLFFRHHLFNPNDVYLLAGDESIVTKSGKKTYGLDRFFSGLYGKPVPGLAFFALSLISINERRSYPIRVEQQVRDTEQKPAPPPKKDKPPATKRKPGRPKGSKNKDKTEVTLTAELELIKSMVLKLLLLINGHLPLTYLVLDGHFGNNNALQMTRQCGLHLISKLRHDAALYIAYAGPQKHYGQRRKYGDKIDYANLPAAYLKQTTVVDGIQTCIYQAALWRKEFPQLLNVVIIVKVNLETGAQAHVVLCSSDLSLTYDQLSDYYALRFHIEFNFREAKQYWGLEDFMKITQTTVTNAANLSLFMVNLAALLLRDFRRLNPLFGVLDLKAHFRGRKYVSETIKLLPEKPDPILLAQVFDTVARLGSIHSVEPAFNSS